MCTKYISRMRDGRERVHDSFHEATHTLAQDANVKSSSMRVTECSDGTFEVGDNNRWAHAGNVRKDEAKSSG